MCNTPTLCWSINDVYWNIWDVKCIVVFQRRLCRSNKLTPCFFVVAFFLGKKVCFGYLSKSESTRFRMTRNYLISTIATAI